MTPYDKFEIYYEQRNKEYGKLIVTDKVIDLWQRKKQQNKNQQQNNY